MIATADTYNFELEANKIDGADVWRVWHNTAPNLVTRLKDNGADIIVEPTDDVKDQQSEPVIRDAQQALTDYLLEREYEERGYAFIIHYDEGPELEFSEPFAYLMMEDGFDVSIISW